MHQKKTVVTFFAAYNNSFVILREYHVVGEELVTVFGSSTWYHEGPEEIALFSIQNTQCSVTTWNNVSAILRKGQTSRYASVSVAWQTNGWACVCVPESECVAVDTRPSGENAFV